MYSPCSMYGSALGPLMYQLQEGFSNPGLREWINHVDFKTWLSQLDLKTAGVAAASAVVIVLLLVDLITKKSHHGVAPVRTLDTTPSAPQAWHDVPHYQPVPGRLVSYVYNLSRLTHMSLK